ncbi:8-amino-7-oxononanoate synthase [Pleionea sp. CnH1-48]|uniref:8-amino-7-oxononanoate synthase n=1 Tax=Pleionea sp. CnH1-48 TaxID=2954494 RepID=UPI002097611B|nr:8-amino-7-oxononanoate synthase [Pleionea sp. CnH1-48]MCO7225695.1 8-amino-7-oxononanoate synthase [Pleionea sp. CnH1-48]
MNSEFSQWLGKRLVERQQAGLERKVSTLESNQSAQVICAGKQLINFSSNDYLSLASDPCTLAALNDGARKYGVGSGASHLICGHSEAHELLAQELADWTGREAVALFSSGYMANLAVLNTLTDKSDLLVQDKLNHASLIDSGLTAAASNLRYRHADMQSLQQQLAARDARFKWIVSDGVFSMDGDVAPITKMVDIATQHQALMMIDDAHGIGVLGANGAGLLEQYQVLPSQVTVLMGTLGKALGTAGAFVASSQEVIDSLTQFGRSYIYTTAMSPAMAYASYRNVRLCREQPQRRQTLEQSISLFKSMAQELGIAIMPSDTAIQPVLIHDDNACVEIGKWLRERGFWVGVIRPPTVPKGSARLRVTLNSAHTQSQIEQLLLAIKDALMRFAPQRLS